MKTFQLKNNQKLVLIVWLIPFVLSFFFLGENVMRFVFLISSLLLWLGLYFKSNEKILTSILFLILISSFNVTFTPQILDSCYKNGVFVNYLCPTLHIIDLFLILSIFVTIVEKIAIFKKEVNNILISFFPFLIFLVFYLIFHNGLNEIINISRLILIIALILLNKNFIVDIKKYVNIYVIYSFIGLLLIQFVISLLQFGLGRDLGLQFIGESNLLSGSINSSFISTSFGEFLRAYGTFPHPNVLAGFSLAVSFFALKTYEKKDIYLAILLILSFLISIFTFSRSHIFLNIIVLIYYSLKNVRFSMFNFFPLLMERFSSLNGESTSVVERVRLLNEGLRILKEKWLFGTGGGEFVRFLSNDIRTVSNISLFQPIHNSILLLLIEYGIFGFSILIYYFFRIFTLRKKSILEISIILGILLIISLFDHYLVSLPQGLIVLILFLL